ncbi:hypothetical protein [Haloplanus halobius]|uniref:hypothetical protein n=1 Tax=Haloplanus halobius TaxID=2934938 RepID=UPI00200C9EFD|nr:hypothetical protein [Haloplanus sp. XH21]
MIDFILYAVVVSLPVIAGFAAAYISPSYREDTIRNAGKIALSFLILTVSIASYYLFQHVTGDPYWPDTIAVVVGFGFLLFLVVSVSTLTLGAVGLKLGTYVKMR